MEQTPEMVGTVPRKVRPNPKHGNLRTRRVQRRAKVVWPDSFLPRVGAGTYSGEGTMLDASGTVVHFRRYRNGLPVFYDEQADLYRECRPYVYGAPREAWAVKNLDMDAIREADRQMDQRHTDAYRQARAITPEQLVLIKTNAGMPVAQLAAIAGVTVPTVYRYLRKLRQNSV